MKKPYSPPPLLRIRFSTLPEADRLFCDENPSKGNLHRGILQKAESPFFLPVWFRDIESLAGTAERIADTIEGDGVEAAFLALLRTWNKKGKLIQPRGDSGAISEMSFTDLNEKDWEDWMIVERWREWNKQGEKIGARATEHSKENPPMPVIIGGDRSMVIAGKTYSPGETVYLKMFRGHPMAESSFKDYCREKLGLRFVKKS